MLSTVMVVKYSRAILYVNMQPPSSQFSQMTCGRRLRTVSITTSRPLVELA